MGLKHLEEIEKAKAHFGKILEEQFTRIDRMKAESEFVDYASKDQIVIGIVGGDGIGPFITAEAEKVLAFLLKDDVEKERVVFKEIDGLTIENRAACGKAIPDDVLAELKECDVILKGPTTTPREGDKWPNIESANVAMRRELDLFANVRPVSVPEKGILTGPSTVRTPRAATQSAARASMSMTTWPLTLPSPPRRAQRESSARLLTTRKNPVKIR